MMTEYCEPFATHCRFCSQEVLVVPYAPLIEDTRSKRLIAGSTAHRIEALGTFCNNICKWARDVQCCPARWGLSSVPKVGVRADGCGVYMDSQELPIRIIPGQQVLEI